MLLQHYFLRSTGPPLPPLTIEGSSHNSMVPPRLFNMETHLLLFLYSNPTFYLQTSFLRSSIIEELAAASEDTLSCYKSCATELGRQQLEIKKKNNKSKRGNVKADRITGAAEACSDEYCSTNRSAAETTCANSCYKQYGEEAAKAANKAIDRAVDDAV